MKVYITRELPEIAFELLRKNKILFECYRKDQPIPRSTLLQKVKNCDALISLLTEKIDKELIDQMTKCKVIANYAVGYNNIDIEYAKQKKIIVTNTPDVLTESTADLTMALVLACARRIVEGENLLRKNKFKGWKPKLLLGTELRSKTFGILGAGRIGTAVAMRAKSFGTNIIYFDNKKNLSLEKVTGAKKVSINKLFETSDIISVHLPLNDKTKHILNSDRLNQLKKNVILINTARGEIIDEAALIQKLEKKKLMSIGLDVFENEPNVNPELLKFPNVLVLPHLGSATIDARNGMAELAVKNVVNVLKGKPPLSPVF